MGVATWLSVRMAWAATVCPPKDAPRARGGARLRRHDSCPGRLSPLLVHVGCAACELHEVQCVDEDGGALDWVRQLLRRVMMDDTMRVMCAVCSAPHVGRVVFTHAIMRRRGSALCLDCCRGCAACS
jgi:hypothetical protein